MHEAHVICSPVHQSVVLVFKNCGKTIQKSYKAGSNEKTVKREKLKEWLEEIRQRTRSKCIVSIVIS